MYPSTIRQKIANNDLLLSTALFSTEAHVAAAVFQTGPDWVWIDQEHYRTLKIEYYDRKNALLKTFTATDYAQYLDKFWRASTMNMVNHQSGKTTTLTWKNYAFRTGLNDRDFDRNSLARAR